ncbi:MAG: preprotein translocase subunit SecE [Solirubrobacteraceae bacterium]|nr:preprotein translocase subunit SecE [Solirubrobacteraceae bacterium]MEA2277939.1 preprotein translocase subunit SecE [Solirubrobacteraceae bacterium]MEA2358462.1 preprotein translocase subunit SecE [Solirubrobacteraceae bacterium]
MARDRQRAKQRKARRGGGSQNPGPSPSEPHRANVPGELDHASGEVDEFDAALVRGAGEPADAFGEDEDPDAASRAFGDGDVDVDDAALEREAVAAGPGGAAPVRREEAVPGTPTRRGPGRFLAFLRASWAELQRVQWPDRRQVAQATAVVLGFVIVAGVYLGVADYVAKKLVNIII